MHTATRDRPTGTAEHGLHHELVKAGVIPHSTPTPSGDSITVPVHSSTTEGSLTIKHTAPRIPNRPGNSIRWTVTYRPDITRADDMLLRDPGGADLPADTSATVSLVRRVAADPGSWQPDEQGSDGAPYISAGMHLRRALRAAHINAHLRRAGSEGHVIVGIPDRGVILIDDGARAISHHPDSHPGWSAAHYTHLGADTPSAALHDHLDASSDFAADTAAVIETLQSFLGVVTGSARQQLTRALDEAIAPPGGAASPCHDATPGQA